MSRRSLAQRLAVGALLAATASACSSSPKKPATNTAGSTNVPPSGGGGPTDDAGQATAGTCSFPASPATFSLPPVNAAPTPSFPAAGPSSAACPSGTGKLTYTLLDMNGDLEPDLVATATCDDAQVGQTKWLVYLNQGTGFATTAIDFALPPSLPSTNCVSTSIFDVNGDLLPDFVETSLCTDVTVGTTRWMVYPNQKTGFAPSSVSYALPPGFSAGAFASTYATSSSCSGGKNAPAFQILDVNGDAFLDFVMLASCTDATIGTSAWQVFLGGASGASQTSSSFALPTTPTVTSGAFDALAGNLSCTSTVTRPTFGLLDFDLDGKPDLVVTQQCDDATVGTTSWQWYRNGGTGFAPSAASIALPVIAEAPAGSFAGLTGSGQCANGAGAPTYVLADIDGDRVLDMVVTRDCADALTGVSYWTVFPSASGAGFTSPGNKLQLPEALGASSSAPAGLSGTSSCSPPARPSYTTTYLSGTSLQIVLTAVCNDPTVGDSRWLVFPASCP